MLFRNALFSLVILSLSSVAALAGSKPNIFGWGKGHDVWSDAKQFQPYLENAKHPHPSQWADRDWYAEDWISQRQSGLALVQGFYSSDIIRNQDVDDGVPVLIVGPNFYHLSGYDKRRVVHTVDMVYGVTARQQNAAILLKDWYTKRAIGHFDREGLTIQ